MGQMAKAKTVFFCRECGYEASKWMGQCPACRSWNTFTEEVVSAAKTKNRGEGGRSEPVCMEDIAVDAEERSGTGMGEFDRVLGGGMVAGSLVLVGGDPGIGKSTLLLQMCRSASEQGKRVLYISGEESLKQIKLRGMRIGSFSGRLLLLCETNLTVIAETIRRVQPEIVVIDSIQTMFHEDITSAPGSVSQVRESTNVLLQLAKGLTVTIFIVGHVTKEGTVAGPRVLEHMVDTVLYFEGDRYASYRILRAVKNRFGSTNEIGVFEMGAAGLREVENPSEYMLNGRPRQSSGSVVSCTVEGTRPIMVEIQALVSRTNFGMPRRTAAGTDYNRMNLLMAVLEKRGGLHLSDCDAYLNLAGGLRLNEPALDLAIVAAILSSYRDVPVAEGTVVFGEVGLSGEVRAVTQSEQRLSELRKLGFTRCIMPAVSVQGMTLPRDMEIRGVENIKELMHELC